MLLVTAPVRGLQRLLVSLIKGLLRAAARVCISMAPEVALLALQRLATEPDWRWPTFVWA
jgi:hypothetical protein